MSGTPIPYEQALHHALKSAEWAAIRYSSETTTHRAVRNDKPESNESSLDEGAMCEVLVDGHFGYAATADLSLSGLQRVFDRAIATTRATSAHKQCMPSRQSSGRARRVSIVVRVVAISML